MDGGFLLAAPSSGAGKTTVTLGVMRALSKRGIKIAPFKCGPDYIDTQHHRLAAGRSSVNLDLFMSGPEGVRESFNYHVKDAQVAVIEGAMGLFDGYDGMRGSAAEVAVTTSVPVFLVVSGAHVGYTLSATLYGLANWDPKTSVKGVIFNQVGGPLHEQILYKAAQDAGVETIGMIGRDKALSQPSRYLGLTLRARSEYEAFSEVASQHVLRGVDLDKLLETSKLQNALSESKKNEQICGTSVKIGLAKDEAFNFTYVDNLRGAEVKEFSPLRDKELPTDADVLYFPGGYPELYAEALSSNREMRQAVKDYVEAGGRVLAECGGLMYMCNDIDGLPMAGALPMSATMKDAKLSLGYRWLRTESGLTIKGHEFHYSRLVNPELLPSAAQQFNARGEEVRTPIYRYKNLIAGYTHLWWGNRDQNILNIFEL